MPGPNQQTFSNWSGGYDPNAPKGGAIVYGPEPAFRNPKDALLGGRNLVPQAEYPDGYLGSAATNGRRADRLLDRSMRLSDRPYTRGVHKGERINPGDYMWPEEFNLLSGIENELTGKRFNAGGTEPVILVNDGKTAVDRPQFDTINIERQSRMKRLLPSWR